MENELVRAIIDRKIREGVNARLLQQQAQHSNSNILDRIKGIGNRLDNVGGGFSAVGDYLSNNTALSGLGAKSQAIGSTLQNGASAIQNAITPVASGIGASALSSGAGVNASAAGGAVGGAAMSNPATALVALGAMALNGANRKRAEKTGQQTEQLANNQMEIAKNNLSQVPQTVLTPEVVSSPQTLPNPQEIQTPQNNISQNTFTPPEEINKSAFSGVAKGLDDFLTGYRENKTQGFDWNNLQKDDTKSKMQRFGEGIGTIARVSQNPIVQGLVAGGLSGIFSGDPLYGLSSGYKYANSKYKANLYKDILAQQGINVGNNNGIIDANDLSKILTASKYQKDYMTRKDYDRFRLDNGQISIDEYNSLISNPDYNGDEILNVTGLEQIAKAGKYAQENKESRNKNYWRNQNKGQNIVRVQYDEKPESHNYTHVIYDNGKPESKSTTYVKYENKPTYTPPKTITKPTAKTQQTPKPTNNKDSSERVQVKSPDGKVGTIPKNNLIEALKEGYKLIRNGKG
ncbi:hypothetical protein IJ674_10440 [bacterium]|nr:hypothetical protein [bacterium]